MSSCVTRKGLMLAWILSGLLTSPGTVPARAQTFDQPVVVSLQPLATTVHPGDRSALLIVLKIPHGFMVGTGDPAARNPATTLVNMAPVPGFVFESAQFPTATEVAVPVRKGHTKVLRGELHIVVPYTVGREVTAGSYELAAALTYTPALAAGHIRTHVREPYTTSVAVVDDTAREPPAIPAPYIVPVPEDFAVREYQKEFSQPLKTLMYRWPEDRLFTRLLHKMWLDPPHHGKHVQTAWIPFVTFSERSGNGLGMSAELVNATREGIMTGFLQVRFYHNEFIDNTAEIKAISCPDAYYNYQFSSELSDDGKNRQLHLHTEHLGLGADHRLGYEFSLKLAHDPRARFHGLGPGTKEEDKSNYNHQESGGVFDFYILPRDFLRFALGASYRSVSVAEGSDALRREMPWTVDLAADGGRLGTVPGIRGATVAGGRLIAVYDSRNSEFAASDGFYGKLTAEYKRVTSQVETSADPVSGYGRFSVDLRRYKSNIAQNITLVMRTSATLTTSADIPFFDQASFGGEFSDRGFTADRFYGQHSVFGSLEFRYLVMKLGILGMPMEIEMAPFVDVGQVFADSGFGGRFNLNPGVSMRMLNKPNVGIVSNGAWGQDGFVLTGGVELPF